MPTPKQSPAADKTAERASRKTPAQRDLERAQAAEERALKRLRHAEAAYVEAVRQTALKQLFAALGGRS